MKSAEMEEAIIKARPYSRCS